MFHLGGGLKNKRQSSISSDASLQKAAHPMLHSIMPLQCARCFPTLKQRGNSCLYPRSSLQLQNPYSCCRVGVALRHSRPVALWAHGCGFSGTIMTCSFARPSLRNNQAASFYCRSPMGNLGETDQQSVKEASVGQSSALTGRTLQ